jgi:hypothetical protein
MQSRDFCFWLQGFFELGDGAAITPDQAVIIKRHLTLVFAHEIAPSLRERPAPPVPEPIVPPLPDREKPHDPAPPPVPPPAPRC